MMISCPCDEQRHRLPEGLWHRAYRKWYAHDRAGHSARAAAWGYVADRACRVITALKLW